MQRKGRMKTYDIESKHLNERMTLKIYYPQSFSPFTNYHICIMQDGNDYYQLGRIATLSDELHESGNIQDTVFVGIHYIDRYDRREKYHPNGPKNEAYMKFLASEVVPFLNDLIPSDELAHARTLMGDSLAGTLAFMTTLKFPHTFGNIIMQSPLVNDAVLKMATDNKNITRINIYHTIGLEETEVKTTIGDIEDFLTPNRKLNHILKTYHSEYNYKELDGPHTWRPWQKDMKNVLMTMFDY